MLSLTLQSLPSVLGIYGTKPIGSVAAGDFFPANMSLLHPDTAASFLHLQKDLGQRLRVSDMFRTAESSLQAMQEKRGVQAPGYSGHNFGFCVDAAIDAMLKSLKMTKAQLDTLMQSYGWYCHRKDHERGSEDWHYSHFGSVSDAAPYLALSAKSTNTSAALEGKILKFYGASFRLTPVEVQTGLQKLKMYGGSLDGDFGPRSKQSLEAFQRAWLLPVTGTLDERTLRTLATVSAEQNITNEGQVS